jgi:hypothetical protein
LEQPTFDGSTVVETARAYQVSPGVFEVTGIPAGRYNVQLQGQGTNMQMNGVDFGKDGEQIDATAGEPLSSLKISVKIPGESSIPKGLGISLLSKGRNVTGFHMLDAKGEEEIDEVPPGRYEIFAWGARKVYSIARTTAEGAGADTDDPAASVASPDSLDGEAASGAPADPAVRPKRFAFFGGS